MKPPAQPYKHLIAVQRGNPLPAEPSEPDKVTALLSRPRKGAKVVNLAEWRKANGR